MARGRHEVGGRMKRLCDVPECQKEGTHEVMAGWMCLHHAVAWDKASDKGDVFRTEEYMIGEGPDEIVAEECHSKWLGRSA